jgi:membrane protein DedA with SNARE-associated domain
MAAVLAGTNAMAQHSFYFASATAASAWILCYGLAAYSFGEAFGNLASPAAAVLGLAAAATVLSVPVFIVRYEKRLQAKADAALAERAAEAKPSEGFAPAYVAPRRLRIRSTAA